MSKSPTSIIRIFLPQADTSRHLLFCIVQKAKPVIVSSCFTLACSSGYILYSWPLPKSQTFIEPDWRENSIFTYLNLYGLPSDMIPTVVSPRCKSVTGAVHCHCSDLSWWAMCVGNLIHKLACLHFPNLCCQENTSNNENRIVELWIQVQVYFNYYYLLQKNHSYPHIAKANLSG